MRNSEMLTLYHGSKSGIHGAIAPISRERCDFGKGFYMGTDKTQPLTLICNYPNAKMYTLSVDLSGLRILNVEVGLDLALINSLSALKLGKQYAALTKKACENIKIIEEQEFSEEERAKLKQESEANRYEGIAKAEEICRKYRREGRFFDEILRAGD